jgi:ParB family chromosome partitioning protein
MSNKSQESQIKKGRLGRGLNSLLGGNLTLPTEDVLEKKTSVDSIAISKPPGSSNSVNNLSEGHEIKINKEPVVNAPQMMTQAQVIPPEARIWKIAVDKLNPNEYQPRQKFNKETLLELASSIKDKGILQPIVARRHLNGVLEIISGERRWRAAQMAGLHEVPVIIKSVNDQDSLELAIIENIQREDLNPIDEAEAYQKLADEFKLTQQQIAEKVSKDRATVANSMRLLSLPVMVREMLAQQEITTGHAKVLLSINDPKTQHQLAKKVLVNKLSVRALEKIIQGIQKQPNESLEEMDSKEKTKTRLAEAAALELQRLIGTKVSIDYNLGKGKITLAYYSDEEFNEIVEKMKKAWQK